MVKIIFFGTPNYVNAVLQPLEDNYQIVAVVTAPDKPVGRKQTLTPAPVKQLALKLSIQVLTPEKLNDQFIQHLKGIRPDLIVVAAYGKIIPREILEIPKYGALNIHPSSLPKYRGASPIQAAILNGEVETGVTIIQMDEKMDHGPIISTRKVILSDQDTFESLSKKMFEAGADLLIKTIPDYLSGKIKPLVQDHAIASYCTIIKKEDGYFDINTVPTSEKLDRMIRAYYPWPNAWTRFRQGSSGQARIVKFLPEGLIQMEGKKAIPFKDFLNGHPNFPLRSITLDKK